MLMIPELLQVQRYVLTCRFSQDHLELLFNSIRASGAESCREGDSPSFNKASSKGVDSHLHRPGGDWNGGCFSAWEHIEETQLGIDNHYSDLLSLVVFLKIRLHHIARLTSLDPQKGSTRKKLCRTVLCQGFQLI
ncbi:hypothetical protein CesoFtcFv8_020467 [Champsocephalus esox]|uniref:Transposable element P transposase-like RNase H C-terminal domain-containing protein n=1 Tax=Champsocephalus esox TaxID=159716 RepID=A0AAN8BBV7_9TELE|nr:hypothetical protein CesoFtcFv8_020467 [Champsocephalus esox]